MRKKRHTPEEIVSKLRQVDVLVAQGTLVTDAIRSIGVIEVGSETSCWMERSSPPCRRLRSSSKAVSEISCLGRAVDPVQAMARVKRSPKRMANCALAMHHSRAGMVHSFSDRFKTRNSSFSAASSVGKWPRARTARRSFVSVARQNGSEELSSLQAR